MHKNRISVPSSKELRDLVLKEMHNVQYVGHLGYQKTTATIRIQFFWPRMTKDVADYIASSMECQRVKSEHRHQTSFLHPFPISEKKWEVVIIDLITKLPRTTRQHDFMMVVVDKLTKDAHFVPVKMTHTTYNIA
jgi:hypothetical protein